MTKFHMKKDGTPGVCHAQEGNCPLGGNENHVEAETLEQAQQYFDDKNESKAKETQKLSNTIKDLKVKYIDKEAMEFTPSDDDINEVIDNINKEYEDERNRLDSKIKELDEELSKKSLMNLFKDNSKKERRLESMEWSRSTVDKRRERDIKEALEEFKNEDPTSYSRHIEKYGSEELVEKMNKKKAASVNYNLLKNLDPDNANFSGLTYESAKSTGVLEDLPNMDGGYSQVIKSNEDYSVFRKTKDGDLQLVKSIYMESEGHASNDPAYVSMTYIDGSKDYIEGDSSVDYSELLIIDNRK